MLEVLEVVEVCVSVCVLGGLSTISNILLYHGPSYLKEYFPEPGRKLSTSKSHRFSVFTSHTIVSGFDLSVLIVFSISMIR